MEEVEGFEPPRGVTRLSVFKTDPFSQTWVYLHINLMSYRQKLIYHILYFTSTDFQNFYDYIVDKCFHRNIMCIKLQFMKTVSILVIAVLGGKVAVSCNSQSALARLNSFFEAVRIVWSAFCT